MRYIDVVFDAPPGPDGGRFVEVEDHNGKAISIGEWLESANGLWVLRIPMPMTLKEVLSTQYQLQSTMNWPTGTGEAGVKENLLHVVVETVEALREINFKPWKTKQHMVDHVALATELTDILQFWANTALSFHITAEELETALRAKWEVNHQRIKDGEVVGK